MNPLIHWILGHAGVLLTSPKIQFKTVTGLGELFWQIAF